MRRFHVVSVLWCLILTPGNALAQGKGAVELGFDGGLTYSAYSGADDRLSLDLPIQSVRAGFYLSDKVEVESSLRMLVTRIDQNTTDSFDWGIGLLVHLADDPKRATPFLLGGVEWSRLDRGFNDATETLRAAFGYKLPVGDQWGVRLQLEGRHIEESAFVRGYWEFGPRFGISVFTK